MAKDNKKTRAKDVVKATGAPKRVDTGENMMARLLSRNQRRPTGNSSRFWKNIDTEDPFAPPRPVRKSTYRPVYVSGRFVRLEDPNAPKPEAKPSLPHAPPPKPNKMAGADPNQVHTPDPRPVQKPRLPKVAEAPPVEEEEETAVGATPSEDAREVEEGGGTVDRSIPKFAPKGGKRTPAGRIRTGSAKDRKAAVVAKRNAPAPPKRARKKSHLDENAPPPEKKKSISQYADFMAEMQWREDNKEAIEAGLIDIPEHMNTSQPPPKAKAAPKAKAKAKAAPKAKAKAKAKAAPKAKAKAAPEKPIDRSPSRTGPGGNPGGMDSLFGGGDDSRVRIGKRDGKKGGSKDKNTKGKDS